MVNSNASERKASSDGGGLEVDDWEYGEEGRDADVVVRYSGGCNVMEAVVLVAFSFSESICALNGFLSGG